MQNADFTKDMKLEGGLLGNRKGNSTVGEKREV
jgi:hypothetical protein